jgi:hypothetical protein
VLALSGRGAAAAARPLKGTGTGRDGTEGHRQACIPQGGKKDREKCSDVVGWPSGKAVAESAVPVTDGQLRSSTDASPALPAQQQLTHSSAAGLCGNKSSAQFGRSPP